MIYLQHAFMQKQIYYNDHFSSSSLELVISILFQICRGWQTFWTPSSSFKQAFPLPGSVSIDWSGP